MNPLRTFIHHTVEASRCARPPRQWWDSCRCCCRCCFRCCRCCRCRCARLTGRWPLLSERPAARQSTAAAAAAAPPAGTAALDSSMSACSAEWKRSLLKFPTLRIARMRRAIALLAHVARGRLMPHTHCQNGPTHLKLFGPGAGCRRCATDQLARLSGVCECSAVAWLYKCAGLAPCRRRANVP